MTKIHITAHRHPASSLGKPWPDVNLPAAASAWLQSAALVPVSAFAWTCEPDWQVTRQVADDMWFWIRAGTGWAWVDRPDAAQTVGPGDLILIPREAEQHVRPDPGVRFHLYTVHFFATVYGAVDLLSLLGLAGVFHAAAQAPFAHANESLAREYALQAPGWQQAMGADIWQVLLHALRHGPADGLNPAGTASARDLARLQPALDAINSRLGDSSLRVADLATCVHVSEVYLRKLFHRAFRMGPTAFVRRQRLSHACALLRTTDQPIKQIAKACGFTDLPFFHRTFRTALNTTPQRYRRTVEI